MECDKCGNENVEEMISCNICSLEICSECIGIDGKITICSECHNDLAREYMP